LVSRAPRTSDKLPLKQFLQSNRESVMGGEVHVTTALCPLFLPPPAGGLVEMLEIGVACPTRFGCRKLTSSGRLGHCVTPSRDGSSGRLPRAGNQRLSQPTHSLGTQELRAHPGLAEKRGHECLAPFNIVQ
jgi:hypothetical protein